MKKKETYRETEDEERLETMATLYNAHGFWPMD
jgi:hypothetical protein